MSKADTFESLVRVEADAAATDATVSAEFAIPEVVSDFFNMEKLLEWVRKVLAATKDDLPSREELLERAGKLFDFYVKPIDLPINNLIEPTIDTALKFLFLQLVGASYDFLLPPA